MTPPAANEFPHGRAARALPPPNAAQARLVLGVMALVVLAAVGAVLALALRGGGARGFAHALGGPDTRLLLGMIAGVVALLVAIPMATSTRLLLGAMLFVPPLAAHFFSNEALEVAFFKVYFFDPLFVLLLGHLAWGWLAAPRLGHGLPLTRAARAERSLRRRWLTLPLIAMLVMGALQVVRSLALGLDPNDVLGDFRRGYFYLLAYSFPLLVGAPARATAWYERLMMLLCAALIAKGFGQALLGAAGRRMAADAAHLLSHFEITVVAFLAFSCVGRLVSRDRLGRLRARWGTAAAGTVLATLVVLLGNFRATWLGFFVGAAAIFALLPLRAKTMLAGVGVLGVAAVACLFLLMRDVRLEDTHRTVGEEVTLKVDRLLNPERDHNVIWRYQSYKAALETWATRPWLGCGLGHKNSFMYVRSDGSYALATRHRTHNSYLWVLNTVGVVGLLVFLAFHGLFVARVVGAARALQRAGRAVPPLAIGLVGFYVCFMTATAFDVLLEESIPILTLAVAMGMLELSLRGALVEEIAAPRPERPRRPPRHA